MEAAEGTIADIVQYTIYISHIDHWAEVNGIVERGHFKPGSRRQSPESRYVVRQRAPVALELRKRKRRSRCSRSKYFSIQVIQILPFRGYALGRVTLRRSKHNQRRQAPQVPKRVRPPRPNGIGQRCLSRSNRSRIDQEFQREEWYVPDQAATPHSSPQMRTKEDRIPRMHFELDRDGRDTEFRQA